MFEISENADMGNAKIRVVGIGGGGCNAVNTMIRAGLEGVEYVVANTDAQALNASLAPTKIQLGIEVTKGLGAGANPEVGRKAALDEYEKLSEVIEGTDMVFITAGMGGGTGTGAAPIVAKLAKELGILTVGVVTKPFLFEGKKRIKQAIQGIEELKECVDSLIMIPNQKLLHLAGESLSLIETFKKADEVLLNAVQGISDLINNTGLINADFADVSTVMANKGMALMGTGICSGADRAVKAANEAISSPLLEDITIDGATGIIVNVTGDKSLTTHEANEAMTLIMEAADEDAEIIFGTVIDESLNDSIKITVVATGLAGDQDQEQVKFVDSQGPREQINISSSDAMNGPEIRYADTEDSGEQTLREIEGHVESAIAAPTELNDKKSMLALKIKESATRRELVHTGPEVLNNSGEYQEKEVSSPQWAAPEQDTRGTGKAISEVRDDVSSSRAKSIAERLGFINFSENEFDAPSYSRKDQ